MSGSKGEMNGNAIFTVKQIIRIRQLGREKLTNGRRAHSANEIALQFEAWTGIAVTGECVRRILRRETWKHVPDVATEEEAAEAMKPPMPLSQRMDMEAMALRAMKLQEEVKNNQALDELAGKGGSRENGI